MNAVIDILKTKLKNSKSMKELSGLNDIILLEFCTIKGLITYPEFISLN